MRWLAAVLSLLPMAAHAASQCDPTTAPIGSLGCSPTATIAPDSSYVYLWDPSQGKNAQHKILIPNLFNGRGAPNLSSPGPIGNVAPNTGAFTQVAVNSLVIGSPPGGDMGPGSLNLVSLFVGGQAIGPIETFTPTNKGGAITLGGLSQTLMVANPNRVGCSLQAQTGDLWFNTVGAAAGPVQPSRYLPAPSEWSCPTGFRGAITIYGSTTGISFSAEEDTVP